MPLRALRLAGLDQLLELIRCQFGIGENALENLGVDGLASAGRVMRRPAESRNI
jgi:hypothetical protein